MILNNNGVDNSNLVSISGSVVGVSSLSGLKTTVYGKSETKPMHQIYRQPTGQIWEHKGSKTTPIEFDGVSGNPKSQHPGYIPLYGRKRYTKLSFNYGDINTFGPDLRYSYDSQLYYRDGQTDITGHQASGDKVKDYSKEGYAVTTAYEVVRPNNWFGSSALATISSSGALITDGDKLVQNTIEIYDADKYKSSYNAIPLSVGQGNLAGQGMIRTMMLLDSSVPEEQIEEYPDSDGSEAYPVTIKCTP